MPQASTSLLTNRAPNQAGGAVDTRHYENFPVASWLCPPHLRAPIAAIYSFARTADDIADEGDASAQQRLEDLAALQADLLCIANAQPHSGRWPGVFDAMAPVLAQIQLPLNLLTDLLDAFAQDVIKTRDKAGYSTQRELLDYCRRSANPIGRLLLHLYEVSDEASLRQSDNICTALQLINFWQDLSLDLPRGRFYLPAEDCDRFRVTTAHLLAGNPTQPILALIKSQVELAKTMMLDGAPLAKHIPGRAGWELRLVVQGGLRIIDKIEQMQFATLAARPTIKALDAPVLLWRAVLM
jgi:hydroxysqualene synthase